MSKQYLDDETRTGKLSEYLLSIFTAEGVGEYLMHATNSLHQKGQKADYQNNEE